MNEMASDSEETRTLLDRVRSGDRRAFELLFIRHRSDLLRAVELRLDPKLRPRVDASDVVQEAQLEALERLPDYLARKPMPFRLWLRKTAYERLMKIREQHVDAARRSVNREVPLPDRSSIQLAQKLVGRGSTPSQQLARQELIRRVHQTLAQLPDADREILVMRYLEKLSNQEVGYILELDPATVSKRHGRALLRMQKVLLESGLSESQL